MKQVICSAYGNPEVLKLIQSEKPEPKDNEVLIKIVYSSVSVRDRRIRAFDVPKSFRIPARFILGFFKPRKQVLGIEIAGFVEAIGKNVKKWKVGDSVLGSDYKYFGGYQEYICVKEDYTMVHIPKEISLEEAAAIPVGSTPALHYLKKANIKSGEKVLVYGASGSVGTYAVQLANLFGAEVTAVSSTVNHDLLYSLGAKKCIDYSNPNLESVLENYDVVFMAYDKVPFQFINKFFKEKGIYIDITVPFKTREMKKSGKVILAGERIEPTEKSLLEIATLVTERKIKVVIDKVYNLDNIVEAHTYVDKGHKKGNVVIKV